LKEPLQIGQEKGLLDRRVGAGAASAGVEKAAGLGLEVADSGGEIILVASRLELRSDIAAGTRFSSLAGAGREFMED